MAERTVKINLSVDSKSGQASIKKTSTQIKALGTTTATSGVAMSKGMKTASVQIKSLGTNLQKTSKHVKDVGKASITSGGSITSSMKKATTNVKSLGKTSQKTSKQIKNIGVSATKSGASIQRTSGQLKGLSAAAIASGAAVGTVTKTTAGGILMMGAATAKAAASTTKLSGNTYKLIKSITKNTRESLKMALVWKRTSKNMLAIAKASGATENAIKKLTKDVEESERAFKKCRKEHIKYNKDLRKQKNTLDGGGSGGLIGAVGKYKTVLIALAVAGLGAAAVSGAKFEREMATVGGVMRASKKDMVALTNAAKTLGSKSEHGANKAAQALKFMGMAGYTAEQAIKALPGVLNLSTASGLDLALVSDIVTDSLTAMGMGVDQLSRFNDVLVGVTTRSNTSIAMMGESLKYVAPVASQMGYDIEQLSAMLGILANSGIKASDAGTDLRQAMIKNVKVAKIFGTAENDLIGTLEKAVEANWGVTEVTEKYGLIAAKSVLVLMKQIKEYKDLEKELRNVKGEAEKLAKTKLDTLTGDFNLLWSATKGLGISISTIINPSLRKMLQILKDAVVALDDYIGKFKDLAKKLGEEQQLATVDAFTKEIEHVKQRIEDIKATIEKGVSFTNWSMEDEKEDLLFYESKLDALIRRRARLGEKTPTLPTVTVAGEKIESKDDRKAISQEEWEKRFGFQAISAGEEEFLAFISTAEENQIRAIKKTRDELLSNINYYQNLGKIIQEITDIETAAKEKIAVITQAGLDKETEKRAADHEKVLQYISTEEENALRAIENQRTAMLLLTTDEAERREINATADKMAHEAKMSDLQKWAASTKSIMEQTEEITIHAAETFSSGFTDAFFEFTDEFVRGTKSAEDVFKQFAVSFLRQIAKMIMQQFILNTLKDLMGTTSETASAKAVAGNTAEAVSVAVLTKAYLALATAKAIAGASSGGGGGGGTTAAAKGMVVSNGQKMMEYAKGAAFNNGMKMHAFATGGVVNSPTIFPMANGMGLMGEAGPEAIMPLKRGKDGKLGVETSGRPETPDRDFSNEINLSVTNLVDPAMIGQYLASRAGKDAIINIISNNRQTVKRSLL